MTPEQRNSQNRCFHVYVEGLACGSRSCWTMEELHRSQITYSTLHHHNGLIKSLGETETPSQNPVKLDLKVVGYRRLQMDLVVTLFCCLIIKAVGFMVIHTLVHMNYSKTGFMSETSACCVGVSATWWLLISLLVWSSSGRHLIKQAYHVSQYITFSCKME